MSGKRNIDENELDELLKKFYLDENAVNPNEKEADFVLSQNYNVKVDPEKEKTILKRLGVSNGRGGWFIVSGLLFIVLCLLVWQFLEKKEVKDNIKSNTEIISSGEISEVTTDENPVMKNLIKIKDTFCRPKKILIMKKDSIHQSLNKEVKVKEEIIEKTVPFISDADIIRYRKLKEQLLSRLVRGDKNLYTHIPASKTNYKGRDVIIDGFTLRNVGITNLEYKIFLAELLSQKRNDEYLVAEVKNEGWINAACPGLATSYFSSEKYNDFPVVNITYDGANLFCKWLQQEVDVYVKANKIKVKDLSIRMPYDEEWIYAAKDGYAKIAFEQGYNTIYDESEGLVNKAFTKRAELVKKRVKKVDTLYAEFTTNHYGWSETKLNEFFEKGFGYYKNVDGDTIYSERMKVLGKIGRVSEMTGQRVGSKLYLSGLSWSSKEEYNKLESEFKANLFSPFVGFRIVIINPVDPEYKNPFW